MTLLVFKTSVGFNKVPGGFDSHPPPPFSNILIINDLDIVSLEADQPV